MSLKTSGQKVLVSSFANIKPFIHYCENNHIQWRDIAHKCGLPAEQFFAQNWFLSRDLTRFIYLLEQRVGLTIGVDAALACPLRETFPLVADIFDQATNIEVAIEQLAANINKINNHIKIWTEKIDGTWWLCHLGSYPVKAPGFAQAEWFRTMALIRFCRQFNGTLWLPEQLRMISDNNDAIENTFFASTNITYQGKFSAISLNLPEKYSAIKSEVNSESWADAIYSLMQTYATIPNITIERFASVIGLSQRTLQRHLKQNQQSFKALKDDFRREFAIKLLLKTNLNVQEISWQVGYSDLSNFNRAFKSWVGMTAPAYRKAYSS